MFPTLLASSSGSILIDGMDPARHLQFMAPGVIAMTVLFSSMFSGIGLLWDRQFGFRKETLVAPVPRIQIMFGGTYGSATTAMLQGTLVAVVCLPGALYPLDNLPKALIALTHIDPMTYGVDGLRAALIERSHFTASVDALVLIGVGAVLTVLGAWCFSKIEV